MNNNSCILFCRCAHANIIPARTRDPLLEILGRRRDVLLIDDLCGCAAEKDPCLEALTCCQSVTVIACYPRAVRWLLERAGVKLDWNRVTFCNMRVENADAIRARVERAEPADNAVEQPATDSQSPSWIPWYPVIDRSRCTNCGQCREFCLFGVYELDQQNHVHVAQPKNCKNNCPACARICPHAAIMFPKYEESPINGAEIEDEEGLRRKIRVNVDEILGSDVYATLAGRRQKRQRLLLKRQGREQAVRERDAYRRCENGDGTPPCS